MFRQSGCIQLLGTRTDPRIIGALERIFKKLKTICAVKRRYQLENFRGRSALCQTNDLRLKSQKTIIESSPSDDQKIKWKQFANRLRTNLRKENISRILFSDKEFFDIDGVYNSENERVWAINCADADENSGVTQKLKFPERK